jgi:hypothetical protein
MKSNLHQETCSKPLPSELRNVQRIIGQRKEVKDPPGKGHEKRGFFTLYQRASLFWAVAE